MRRDLARAAGELLLCADDVETAAALMDLLAADPKWEVRQAVAELLPQMPDDLFARLAAGLSQDANSFVARAAERARHIGERLYEVMVGATVHDLRGVITPLKSGAVRVCTEAAANEVRITVADDGMGLAPEDLREISEFIPGRTSKKNYGTGFGLPIARRNIAGHGGSITLDSRENQGTTVTITLPLESPEEDCE